MNTLPSRRLLPLLLSLSLRYRIGSLLRYLLLFVLLRLLPRS